MFRAVLYFDGPLSKWLGAPAESEIIAVKTFRFRFLAEVWLGFKAEDLNNVRAEIQPQ